MNPQQKEISGTNAEAHIHGVGLFIAVAAIGLSLLSTGLWIATMVFAPQIVDAKIKAGSADAYALAELARKEASTAKDLVDKDRAKAKALEELKNERR
jgi:hypothetical protein